jgi:hypothetical protein
MAAQLGLALNLVLEAASVVGDLFGPVVGVLFGRGLTAALRLAYVLALVGTGVAFLIWLGSTLKLAAKWSETGIRWTATSPIVGFLVPFLNFVRPYQIVRDLHDQLAPDGVPEPAPRPRTDGAGGYRASALEKAPPPRALAPASIGAWWAFFLLSHFVGRTGVGEAPAVAAVATSMIAATLAILVVRTVHGRLEERYRRVRHASDEELDAWGIPTDL